MSAAGATRAAVVRIVMLVRRLVVPLSGLVALAVLPAVAVSAAADDQGVLHVVRPDAPPAPPEVARGLIVRTEDGLTAKGLRVAADRAAGRTADVTDVAPLVGDLSKVSFDAPVPLADALRLARSVQAQPGVALAVPDARRQVSAAAPVTPDDPDFTQQLGVWDATRTRPVGGYSVKAPALWRKTKGSPSVVVAVVDTGITDHPDLRDQLVAGYDFVSVDTDENGTPFPEPYTYYSSNDGDGRDGDPSDPGDWTEANDEFCYGEGTDHPFEPSSWHGTHVAGIIAAEADNGIGITGIAPRVKIQPVRALGRCGGYDSDILDGILWASGGTVDGVPRNRTPADVVNLSLGALVPPEYADYRDEICEVYGDVAADARARGTTLVAAAGNEEADASLSVPASCPGYTAVGATSESGYQAFYSNEGRDVDLSAPGGDFVVPDPSGVRGHGILSTLNTGLRSPGEPTYVEYMGTSMATPAVAAGAALLYSLGLTDPHAVVSTLKATAASFAPNDPYYAHVRVTDRDGSNGRYLNLNCDTATCGSGIMDLSRIPTLSVSGWPRTARRGVSTRLVVKVADSHGPVPDTRLGVVRVVRGDTLLARARVVRGVARVTIPGRAWRVGANRLTVRYSSGERIAKVAQSRRTVTARR